MKKPKAEAFSVLNREYDPECPIESLTLFTGNPRQGDIGALHQSIENNGFYGALIVQKSTGRIIAGNHRYQAAVQRGATTVPVIWVDGSDAEAKRILIADNRTNDIADYDNQALAELLEQVKIDETELGFQGTGWDDESYQQLLNDLSGPIFGEEPSAGDSNAVTDAETKSLADRFVIPPFSVLDARQGYWQERKRAWLALGIQSELGRGGAWFQQNLSPPDLFFRIALKETPTKVWQRK